MPSILVYSIHGLQPRAILHNPFEYPNPDAFDPDRYILHGEFNPNVRLPETVAFGFGRRYETFTDISSSIYLNYI